MWRYDATRSGASPEQLPEELHLQWTLELPTPQPAWPSNQEKLQFDRLYEPVLSGKTLFVPSMISDKLTAYDTDSAEEKWVFYAEGPIRFAPLVWEGKVYFNCDDSFLYCLNADDGTLVWKFRGGPSDRQVLGQDRLISIWSARGAVVVRDGILYFGAGIWPFEGIFLYALDPASGDVIWQNTGSGSTYLTQQHGSPAFSGVAPQGYIAATSERLVVSGGRTMPAVYDRNDGKFLHFNVSSRSMGSKGGGGYEVTAGENFYLNRDKMYRLDNGKFIATVGAPVVTEYIMIGADKGGLKGYKPGWRLKEERNKRGEVEKKTVVDESWSATLDQNIGKVFIQSGSRLYGTGKKNTVLAVDLPMLGRGARVSWKVDLPDEPLNMLTGDGKLFVTTDQGRIYAFGGTPSEAQVQPVQVVKLNRSHIKFPRDRWTRVCREILRETVDDGGYALALGLGSGRLVEELLSQSDYHVFVVEEDAKKVDAFRRRMDSLGVYGHRVAVRVADPSLFELPPYFASLVVAEDPAAVRSGGTGAFVSNVFGRLRPFSGVACFLDSPDEVKGIVAAAQEARLDGGESEAIGDLAILRRTRAPAGAANWTHQYGDASNSAVSADTRVKVPMGLLWFGGPSNEEVLPRHGHGPTPQVADGRVFIQGRNMLRATDAYTGRLLWQRELTDVGIFYDYTSHEPGANLIGSNYVSLPDGIYVVYGKKCLRLDPATGETLSEFSLPRHAGEEETPEWGYIGIWEDVLVAGAKPSDFTAAGYTEYRMRRFDKDSRKKALAALLELKGFVPAARKSGDDGEDMEDWEVLLANANKLLLDEKMVARIPDELRKKSKTEEAEKGLEEYLNGDGERNSDDEAALRIKREILHRCFDLPKYDPLPAGRRYSLRRSGSQKLVGMNRNTGRLLWEFESYHALRHNAIAPGGGKVFAIDRLSDWQLDYYKRRGLKFEDRRRVVALDIHRGTLLWEVREGVFGTWLGYSATHDILLEAGSKAGDRARDEVGKGMNAYKGYDGALAWENDLEYSGPCLLLGGRVITQGYREPAFALDVRTGKESQRRHPISGKEVPWQYTRNYGCNTAIGCPNLLTFRSAAAGYYDLLGDSGTGNFGGFRSGCTTNLIPASGVLNAPDYTRTCSCSYQNQSSLGLVHMPDLQMWTFNRYQYDDERVEQVGINLGAPGDRLGDDKTLWLDYPSVGGESPDLPTVVFGEELDYPRVHASQIEPHPLSWVGASALRASAEIVIQLAPRPASSVANEIADRPALRIANGQLSPAVFDRSVPQTGAENRTCLTRRDNGKELGLVVPHHDELHVEDLTLEYWIRRDGDASHVDARGRDSEGKPFDQGFVVDTIDGGKLRARYFVADEKGENNEKELVITTDAQLAAKNWAHVAFTYAMETGTASLWVDGELVGLKDGEDKRALWWEGHPDWEMDDSDSRRLALDEVRVLNRAIGPEKFLRTRGDKSNVDAKSVVGQWRMEAGSPRNDIVGRTYTVRLVFAELERKGPGERVFDVLLQGRPVLENFDIVKEAGQPYRTIVKEFSGVELAETLELRLEPKGEAQPLLAGIQLRIDAERPATSD